MLAFVPMMEKPRPPVKIKERRKNAEKRKLKSRDAARCRRTKETEIFSDLASLLPIGRDESKMHLDKSSILRLIISYFQTRITVESLKTKSIECNDINDQESSISNSIFTNTIEGFVLILNVDGDIVFASDNVRRYLGFTSVDVLGQSIFEMSHPCDQEEIKDMLFSKNIDRRTFLFRLKSILSCRGRNINAKSTNYKVVRVCGRKIEITSVLNINGISMIKNEEDVACSKTSHFVILVEPLPHPANIEVPLGHNIFLTKHTPDMKFTYADEKIKHFFGYEPIDLLEKSFYDYHYAEDTESLQSSFKDLFKKGQSQTEMYRFLAFGGGYAWIISQATLIKSSTDRKPLNVVCVNYIISDVEMKNHIYSCCQLETLIKEADVELETVEITKNNSDCVDNEKYDTRKSTDTKSTDVISANDFLVDTCELIKDKKDKTLGISNNTSSGYVGAPHPATSTVFVPFTKDMDKGFLGFNDNDENLTVLKDDKEDLTHLAPRAGEDNGEVELIYPDNLEDFIFSDFESLPISVVQSEDCENSPLPSLPIPNDDFISDESQLISFADENLVNLGAVMSRGNTLSKDSLSLTVDSMLEFSNKSDEVIWNSTSPLSSWSESAEHSSPTFVNEFMHDDGNEMKIEFDASQIESLDVIDDELTSDICVQNNECIIGRKRYSSDSLIREINKKHPKLSSFDNSGYDLRVKDVPHKQINDHDNIQAKKDFKSEPKVKDKCISNEDMEEIKRTLNVEDCQTISPETWTSVRQKLLKVLLFVNEKK